MAYALVAWRGDDEAIDAAMEELGGIPFFRGLFLIREDGASWPDVREALRAVVEANPGTEAVIIMPAKGARVGGWVDTAPTPADLEEARAIMNRSGSNVLPILLATPLLVDDEG